MLKFGASSQTLLLKGFQKLFNDMAQQAQLDGYFCNQFQTFRECNLCLIQNINVGQIAYKVKIESYMLKGFESRFEECQSKTGFLEENY